MYELPNNQLRNFHQPAVRGAEIALHFPHLSVCASLLITCAIAAPARGIWSWRQCMEVRSDGFSARSAKKEKQLFHLHFSVVWMGSHSTVVLCTALSLTSAFHVICDITEQKKSTPKARYGKMNLAESWWGSSRTTKREQLTVSNCMHVLHSHQLNATMWVPLPPNCIAHAY